MWSDGIHMIVISIEKTELDIHSDRNHGICVSGPNLSLTLSVDTLSGHTFVTQFASFVASPGICITIHLSHKFYLRWEFQ